MPSGDVPLIASLIVADTKAQLATFPYLHPQDMERKVRCGFLPGGRDKSYLMSRYTRMYSEEKFVFAVL